MKLYEREGVNILELKGHKGVANSIFEFCRQGGKMIMLTMVGSGDFSVITH